MIMSELVALSSELDISRCAQEPIHIPGAIQPHGALLAVQVGGSAITHASANLAAILGRPVEAVLGQTLAAIFGEAAAEALSLAGLSDGTDLRQTLVVPGPDGGFLHLQSHLSGKRICVDIEPLRPALWQQPPVLMAQSVVDTFKAATSCSELCGFAVRGLKLITGYDRVMAYRFDQDGNGEVIAEFCEAELTPYFGQHQRQTSRSRPGGNTSASVSVSSPIQVTNPCLLWLTMDGTTARHLT
jgi:light-regulated signal transduction histidine kinase (bacteriophytochrome)